MPDVSRGLEELKADYLQHLRLKNYSPLTLRQVGRNLGGLVGYLLCRGVSDAGQVDRDMVETYKASLSERVSERTGRPLTVATIQERLYCAQGWFAWLRKKGVLFFDPAAEVKAPRCEKRLPQGVLRPDEMRKLLEQPDLKRPLGYRDRTMMEVLYATGMRSAELRRLLVSDVDLEKKAVRIRQGKGGRDRFAPLTTPCCRFLDRYLREVRPRLAEGMRPAGRDCLEHWRTGGELLFLSIYGGSLKGPSLAQVMRGYMRRAGIRLPCQPVHSFRHSVATHLLEGGMDIRYVQTMLGHRDISATQIYTHVERGQLKRLLKKCHPRELARETVHPFIVEAGEAHVARA